MSACAECRQAIYGSVSIDALADGLNARTLREIGKRRQMRFRGVDAFDLMHWCVRGLPPSVQVGKWCAMPDLNGREILVLALRTQGYGQKAIAERAEFKGKGQAPHMKVRKFLERLGLPTKSHLAVERLKSDYDKRPFSKRAQREKKDRNAEKRRFLKDVRVAEGAIEIGRKIGIDWAKRFMAEQKKLRHIATRCALKLNAKEREQAQANRRRSERMKTDPAYALIQRSRKRTRDALKVKGIKKSERTIALIGCSGRFLKAYIEVRFLPGMGWHNMDKWHLDHVKPLASFNLKLRSHQRAAFHFTNLVPMWAMDNVMKGAKVPTQLSLAGGSKESFVFGGR